MDYPDYPHLLLAIRSAGHLQYQVAHAAGIREGRLSEIVRRAARHLTSVEP